MGLYKQKFNPISKSFNLVPSELTGISFKEAVDTFLSLPLLNNNINDGRFTLDTGNLYIWNGLEWINQGGIIDISWDAITDKPDLIQSSEDGDWKVITNIQYNSITKKLKFLYET